MLASENAGSSQEETLSQLKEILRNILLLENAESMSAETRFIEDLNFDSLQMVDVVIAMEDGFNIKLPSDINIFEEVQTLGAAANLIDVQLSAKKLN